MLKQFKDPVTGREWTVNVYDDGKGIGVEVIDPDLLAETNELRRADVYIEFYDGKMQVVICPTPEVVMGESEPTVIEVFKFREEK